MGPAGSPAPDPRVPWDGERGPGGALLLGGGPACRRSLASTGGRKHPEHGELLVVSRQPDWKPENLKHRKTLTVSARQFDGAWIAVQNYVSSLHAGLEPGSARMVTLADKRTGKILIWSPSKKWLQEALEAAEKSIAAEQEARERLNSYKVRHLRATRLLEAVLKELPEADRDHLHMVVAPGNHLLYRAKKQLSDRVRESLIKLDKPPEKVR